MASQETQRKLLLTVAFAGAVTAWIAFRVSREEDKPVKADASADAQVLGTVPTDASLDSALVDALAPAPQADATIDSDAAATATDAAMPVEAATPMDATTPVVTGEPRTKVEPDGPSDGPLLAQLDVTAEARKPLLNLLGPTDAGAVVQKTIGRLPLPSGKLGLYGCTVHPYSEDREVLVPAGVYPVLQVASALGEALVVKLLDAPWVSIKQVGRLDVAGEKLCLMGKEAAEQLEAKGSLEDLLALLHVDAGTQAQLVGIPKTKLAFAALDVAAGTGPIYLSYDAKGRTAAVVVGARPK